MKKYVVLNNKDLGNPPVVSSALQELGLSTAVAEPWFIISNSKLDKRKVKNILEKQGKEGRKAKILSKRIKAVIWDYVVQRERETRKKGEPKTQWALISKDNPDHVIQWWTSKPTKDQVMEAVRRVKYYEAK